MLASFRRAGALGLTARRPWSMVRVLPILPLLSVACAGETSTIKDVDAQTNASCDATCTGCCMDGLCVTAVSRSFCGIYGSPCVSCEAGEACISGQCNASSSCAATCKGCCDGEQCIETADATACGLNGATCQLCVSGVCSEGVCTSTPGCNPTSCPTGCCDGTTCVAPPTDAQCGINGSACRQCGSGETCSAGVCIKQSGTCDSTNCATGCCDGTQCLASPTDAQCGISGSACKQCGSDETCSAGVCVEQSGTCDSTNCAGCCDGTQCVASPTDARCGINGGACKQCASNYYCSAGVCTKQSGTCDAASCPTGCCDGTQCVAPPTDARCGINGGACKQCGSGYHCAAGTCTKETPSCSSYCAPGCCDGEKCIVPPTDAKCGFKGAACKACPLLTYCTPLGVCMPKPCDASTCPTGCCMGTVCVTPSNDQHCGLSGATCLACSTGRMCAGGKCVDVRWRVTLASAVLDSTKTWDKLINTAPDPQVHIAMGSTAPDVVSAFSTWIDNTYTPTWNETLFERTEKFITSNKLTLTVMDRDDATFADEIGKCSFTLTHAELTSLKKVVTNCPCPADGKNYVKSLTLRFVKL